jgi:hypothetical protein
VPAIIAQVAGFKSPYYQDYLIASDIRKGTETPVFDIQGWTDPLFPQVNGASMIEKLRAADPAWRAYLYASDVGHPAADNMKFSEWMVINGQAAGFLDLYVRGTGQNPPATYQEQVVHCNASAGSVYSGGTLGAVAPGRVVFTASDTGHATASAPTDSAAGVRTDPLAFYIGNGGTGGCIKLPGAPPANGAMTTWTFPVCSTFTLLGEPELRLSTTIVGTDAEVNSRLWDVAPDGSMTLVTRGMYRWNGTPGAASITYALLGNGWVFPAGHQVRIEVTQNDAPYMRLDNYPSAIDYTSMKLTLPTTAAVSC